MRTMCSDSEVGKRITCPNDAMRLMLPLMLENRETLVVTCLDAERKVITAFVAADGNADSVVCDSRVIFRAALLLDATAILIAHNHPSGNPTPSIPDIQTTRMLEACATILGIVFVDHLVLTKSGRYQSIAEYMERCAL